ncbi:hypothetical protein [Pseudoduganella namucuonensis]|uniref:Uncharacterized protein n=1 Tax=Pseudoduganella namucuonensis TaxID=1035707 RepID=A0A1I7J905_9BURK|nr:hypothetical protein [Pseudoduganella namucuonensis]SFU81653.1 hypothetical protein SAMN05216552_1010164 [Pseudoduganella namucuonensis]
MMTKCELFWTDGQGEFPAQNAVSHTLALNGASQTVQFTFPALERPIGGLRFDFADTPASVRVDGIALKDGEGGVRWRWNGDPAVFDNPNQATASAVEDTPAVMLAGSGLDPNCLLLVPEEALSQAREGWSVEMALVPQPDPLHDLKKATMQRDLAINALTGLYLKQKEEVDNLVQECLAQRRLNERAAAEHLALRQQLEQLADDCRGYKRAIERYDENDAILRKRLHEHESVLKSITSSKWLRRLFPIGDLPSR